MRNGLSRLVLAAMALVPSVAHAEGYLDDPYSHAALFTFSWEYAVPALALRSSFDARGSPMGVRAGVQVGIRPRLTLGGDVAWDRFDRTVEDGSVHVFQAIAGLASVRYYFREALFQPYIGLGVGGVYVEAVRGGGPTQTKFGVCVDPQVGFLWTVSRGLALNFAARYAITSASFDVNGDPSWRVKWPSWFGLLAGISVY